MYTTQAFHTKNAIVFLCAESSKPIGISVLKSGGVRALAETNVRLGSGLAEHMARTEKVKMCR